MFFSLLYDIIIASHRIQFTLVSVTPCRRRISHLDTCDNLFFFFIRILNFVHHRNAFPFGCHCGPLFRLRRFFKFSCLWNVNCDETTPFGFIELTKWNRDERIYWTSDNVFYDRVWPICHVAAALLVKWFVVPIEWLKLMKIFISLCAVINKSSKMRKSTRTDRQEKKKRFVWFVCLSIVVHVVHWFFFS